MTLSEHNEIGELNQRANPKEADERLSRLLYHNLRAIRAYEKAGFRKVKIIPGYEPHEGKIPNAWLMVCDRPIP